VQCSVSDCQESFMEQVSKSCICYSYSINQSLLVQLAAPKEPRKSPRFIIYIAGIKGNIYIYVCMCVFEYQSLRKIQLFKKFWAIIFQSCFNWKNMITLNNDCIHRRQLAGKKGKTKLVDTVK